MNKNIHDLRFASQIKLTDNFPPDQVVMKIGGIPIASRGNISVTLGRAKSRKTSILSAKIAACLNVDGNSFCYSANLPTSRKYILCADTEQSSYHCRLALERIIRLADLPMNIHPEELEFLSLRKYSPKERIAIIQDAIESTCHKLSIVFIDGIRDLINDINDSTQANEIISLLMQWSENYQLHIHVVLHQNKGDLNARGHLGTEAVNKSETVLEVAKDGDSIRSIVRPLFCRNKEFSPFAFFINNEGLPQLDENYVPDNLDSKQRFTYEELSEEQHTQILCEIFKEDKSLGYSQIISKIKEHYSKYLPNGVGDNKAKSLKLFLENKRMILKEDKLYKFNPDFVF
ncbi:MULTISPECIES: hypothetical protein [Chitinophagaceae]